MRIIGTIPHPSISISVFHMNDKFIVKMEAGPMEQTFKFREEEVKGVEDIKKMLDEEFMKKAVERFNEMFLELKRVKDPTSKK
jgi:hypothetical protein